MRLALVFMLVTVTAFALPTKPKATLLPRVRTFYYFEYGRDAGGLLIYRVDVFNDRTKSKVFIGRDWPKPSFRY